MNIPAIRAQLKKAAAREPALKPIADLLSKQLGSFERGGDEDQKA